MGFWRWGLLLVIWAIDIGYLMIYGMVWGLGFGIWVCFYAWTAQS